MKKISILLFALFSVLLTNAQHKHRVPVAYISIKEHGVKQNFDTLIIYNSNNDLAIREIQTFDINGNTLTHITQKWINNSWRIENTTTCTYDDNNNLTSIILYNTNFSQYSGGKPVGSYSYTYDKNGNELTELSKYMGSNAEYNVSTYNEKGEMLTYSKKKWKNNKWAMETFFEYEYFPNGYLLSETFKGYNANKVLRGEKRSYTYGANDNVQSETKFDLKDNIWLKSYRKAYTYNSNNKTSENIKYWKQDKWESNSRENLTYDANNNLLSSVKKEFNGRTWDTLQFLKYTYDIHNNQTSKNNIHNNTKILFQYTYDKEQIQSKTRTYNMSSKSVSIFDLNGNLISYKLLIYENETWTDFKKVSYTYNYNGDYLTGKSETLIDGIWVLSKEQEKLNLFYNKEFKRSIYGSKFKASFVNIQ